MAGFVGLSSIMKDSYMYFSVLRTGRGAVTSIRSLCP